MTVPLIQECEFYTTTTDEGMFIGRCREFPQLRTRPQKTSLDATADIITITCKKLARIADLRAGHHALRSPS